MSESSSRKSIGVLPPMSISAASASTRNRGLAAAQGVRNNWWKESTSVWITSPASFSPRSWAISERSRPSPASAGPSSIRASSRSRNGCRSPPSKARRVNCAKPMRSAWFGAVTPLGAETGCCISHLERGLYRHGRDRATIKQQLDLHQHMGDAIENLLHIALRLHCIRRPRLGHQWCADAEAQHGLRRAVLPLQSDRLADETALGGHLPVRRAAADLLGHVARQRPMHGAGLGERDRLAAAQQRERKDGGLREFLVVRAGLVDRGWNGTKRRRQRDHAVDAGCKLGQHPGAEGPGHAVVAADLGQRGLPAQPLTEIRPALEPRAQRRPRHRPVAATGIIEDARRDPARPVDRPRQTFRQQQRTAEGRSAEEFRAGDQHHVTAVEIGAQPATAEPRLTGIDNDLNLARPAPRDLVETRLAWGTPTEF